MADSASTFLSRLYFDELTTIKYSTLKNLARFLLLITTVNLKKINNRVKQQSRMVLVSKKYCRH